MSSAYSNKTHITASVMKRMFIAGGKMLEVNKAQVDALNVFPVPDGDTGTNMSLTMMSAVKEINQLTSTSMAEFADFVENSPNKKGTGKLQMRVELDAGAEVKIEMQFDSDGVWRLVDKLEATVKRSFYLPIIPRRSDHYQIRLTGTGDWKLYSLVRENYNGSELKSQPGRQ